VNVVFGCDQEVGKWVADQLGQTGFAGYFMSAIGVFDGPQIIGGAVFHNYYAKEGVIEMSSACIDSRWLTRRMIRAIFTYVFDLLECQLVVMRVSSNNSVMLNIANRFGFDMCTIPRLRGRDEGEVICTLTDDAWRSSRFNRRKQSA
jgi:RimJ/RimL family protein N-acetyltransferase